MAHQVKRLLHETDCRWIVEDYCRWCLAKYGCRGFLMNPATMALADLDNPNSSKQFFSEFKIDSYHEPIRKQIDSFFAELESELTKKQLATLVGYTGLSINNHIKLAQSLDPDRFFGSMEKPKFRKLTSRQKLLLRPEAALHSDRLVQQINESKRGFAKSGLHFKLRYGRYDEVELSDRQLEWNQSAFCPGWSFSNAPVVINREVLMDGRAFPANKDQLAFCEQVQSRRYSRVSQLDNYRDAVKENNNAFERIEQELLGDQGIYLGFCSVASNGGLSSFVLRPDVASELQLSQQQIDQIHEIRSRQIAKWESLR